MSIQKNSNNMYGLPTEIKYCHKCNMINQKPTTINEYHHDSNTKQIPVYFDKDNVCHACRSVEKKWNRQINWDEREKELIDLLGKYKNFKGPYNCIIGGSGGKDSGFQSHILKYKYGMRPLTVTWSPHMYTNIGWKNFRSWIETGGFDNFLFTPNGKVHRYLTRRALFNILHPFQPFIMGQKYFVTHMAYKFKIPLIFYGEPPSDYGTIIKEEKKFSNDDDDHPGWKMDPIGSTKIEDIKLGGDKISYYLDQGYSLEDFFPYLPLDFNKITENNIETRYLGYYLKWIPQENFYYASKNTGFTVNEKRSDGTFQKYASVDDKMDNFFYYTSYIKFGLGRAMYDSCIEVRHGHITKDEGLGLINQFDGEIPRTYMDDFLKYCFITREEFDELCDNFRPPHLWEKQSNQWKLKISPMEYFENLSN